MHRFAALSNSLSEAQRLLRAQTTLFYLTLLNQEGVLQPGKMF
jgi:hypothetical protein